MICEFTSFHNKVIELSLKHGIEIKQEIVYCNGVIVGCDLWVYNPYDEPFNIGNTFDYYHYNSITEALQDINNIANNLNR
jgi:hypothetical protein